MSCKEIRKTLHEYVDGELNDDRSREVREHLGACDSCRGEFDSICRSSMILSSLGTEKAPPGFRAEVLRAAEADAERRSTAGAWAFVSSLWRKPIPRYAGLAVAAVLVIAVFRAEQNMPVSTSDPSSTYRSEVVQTPSDVRADSPSGVSSSDLSVDDVASEPPGDVSTESESEILTASADAEQTAPPVVPVEEIQTAASDPSEQPVLHAVPEMSEVPVVEDESDGEPPAEFATAFGLEEAQTSEEILPTEVAELVEETVAAKNQGEPEEELPLVVPSRATLPDNPLLLVEIGPRGEATMVGRTETVDWEFTPTESPYGEAGDELAENVTLDFQIELDDNGSVRSIREDRPTPYKELVRLSKSWLSQWRFRLPRPSASVEDTQVIAIQIAFSPPGDEPASDLADELSR